MKRTLLFLLLLLFGCGTHGTAGKPDAQDVGKITMRFDGREASFEPTYGRFATFKKGLILKDADIQNDLDRVPAVVHRIYLSNYDLELTDPAKQDHQLISAEGQYRIEIQIEADQDADKGTSLRVKEYVHKTQPFDRISYVFLSYLEEGKDRSENLQASEFGGSVKITSVTDDAIEGELDVFDKNEFVQGNFKAKRLIK